jgi:hypothetical protein
MEPTATAFAFLQSPFFWLILIWTIAWKGVALWKAAQNGQKKWFVVMLVLNTLALLEIVYIFYFAKKKETKSSL